MQGRAPLESGRCYQLGRHRLYVGDATAPGALDALMDGAKARLLLTDPPYNVNLYGEARPRSRTDGLRVLNDHWESEDAFEDFLAGALAGCAGHMEPGARALSVWMEAGSGPPLGGRPEAGHGPALRPAGPLGGAPHHEAGETL